MSQFEEQKQEDERIESTENLVNVSLEAVAANRESLEATTRRTTRARSRSTSPTELRSCPLTSSPNSTRSNTRNAARAPT